MNASLNEDNSGQAPVWQARIKAEAYEKVLTSPLMHACAQGGTCPRALFGGFWHFVDTFPGIIRDTYENVLSAAADDKVRRLLMRSAPILSETLRPIEDDERTHRVLWIQASRRVGLSETQLHQWRILPEIKSLTEAIRTEGDLARRLLYFAAVEIVAEGISRYLSQQPPFVEAMGEDGMEWFNVHLVHPDDATTHEALAYNLALSAKRVAHEPTDWKFVDADIQRCVDWFFAGGVACAREFAHAARGT